MYKRLTKDFTKGNLLKQMLIYASALIATNILQVLFHSADVVVLGLCLDGKLGDIAMGAVGANGTLITFITGLFIGLSTGTNVLISKYLGAKDSERVQKNVGMSILLPLIFGVIIFFVGFFGARTFLTMLNVKPELMELAVKYLKIYSFGFPLTLLYNFASAILRAVGDTVRPLIYLIISGVSNIILNVVFVTVFNMTVEGVAIATIVSQGISAILCIITLLKSKEICRLRLKHIRIYWGELKDILLIGLPMGVQSMLFSFANLYMQSSINDIGDFATTGNTVGNSIDIISYHVVHGIALTVLTFVGQNYGAKNYNRIIEVRNKALLLELILGLTAGVIVFLIALPLCEIIADGKEVIEIAKLRVTILCLTYFICGIMDCFSCLMRGLGRSVSAMIISLIGACILRVAWLKFLKMMPALSSNLTLIYITWPVSWIITIGIYLIVSSKVLKTVRKECETPIETSIES